MMEAFADHVKRGFGSFYDPRPFESGRPNPCRR